MYARIYACKKYEFAKKTYVVYASCIEQKKWLNVLLVDKGIAYAIQAFVQV